MVISKPDNRPTVASNFSAPEAFHIGFSKCASTFLQTYFDEHPSIYLVNQSHYIAPFSLSEFPEGRTHYLARFKEALPDQVTLESDEHIIMPVFHPSLGAAATTMDSVGEVITRLIDININAKIIIVVRNQVSLLASRYSEYILCGGTKTACEFVDEFLCCSEDHENYYQNFYSKILDQLRNAFSSDNVLLFLQEELASDEAAVIHRLSDFLRVEDLTPTKRGMLARRVGLSPLGIRMLRFINRLIVIKPKQSYKEAQVRIPFLVYKVIQRMLRVADFYAPMSITGSRKEILTESQIVKLSGIFAADNLRLQEMTGIDLSAFGYPVAEQTAPGADLSP